MTQLFLFSRRAGDSEIECNNNINQSRIARSDPKEKCGNRNKYKM